MNQDKSENHPIFSEISEKLAVHLGINLDELPARIGISKDMFYAYRSGRHRISDKAWRKLETAEAAAGIKPVVAAPVVAAQGAPQAGLAQQLREQAAQLLAMAEQLEPTVPKPSTLTPMSTAYRPATAAERTEAKAELDDIIRTVEAAEDLPEIKSPVVRRRA